MKILYYHKEYQTPMYLWQRVHIIDELAHHGIIVEILNPLDYNCTDAANEAVLRAIQTGKYDLFMTPHNEKELFVDTLLQIKKFGIPTLLICFDNLVAPYIHRKIAKYYDLVWLTSYENQDSFSKWGAQSIVLPYAANPYAFKYRPQPEILRVAFIGTPYGSRVNMLNILLKQNIPVTLYGKAFSSDNTGMHDISNLKILQTHATVVKEHFSYPIGRKLLLAAAKQRITHAAVLQTDSAILEQKPAVSFEHIPSLYGSYALALSSSTARNTGVLKNPVYIINLRGFEIPMCGGIQICKYNPELSKYFMENQEILFYRSNEEFIEKVQFYLSSKHEHARSKIRTAARKRAEGEHTWFLRFKKVFSTLGLTY